MDSGAIRWIPKGWADHFATVSFVLPVEGIGSSDAHDIHCSYR
jgi:hypothetical protein